MLTTKQVAKVLKMSYTKLLGIIKEGLLKPTYLVGKRKMWEMDDVRDQLRRK